MYRGLLFLLGCWLSISSCNVFENDLDQQKLIIEFSARDGWGAYNKSLRFTEDGIVTLTSTYPELTRPLSNDEFNRLKILFHRYQEIDYEPRFYCADNVYLNINITEGDNFTNFNVDTCIFMVEEEWDEAVQRFDQIFQFMEELYENVHSELSPWKDLEVEYTLNSESYGLGDEIIATYQIHNPTLKDRELWFQKGYPIYFTTGQRIGEPFLYFRYPENYRQLDDDPLMIPLLSGETKTISYTWDQSFSIKDSTVYSVPGRLTIFTSFMTSELPGKRHEIEILDN